MRIYKATMKKLEAQAALFRSIGRNDLAEGMFIALSIINSQPRRARAEVADPSALRAQRVAALTKARAARADKRQAVAA